MRIAFDTGTGSIVIGKGQGEILEINVGALTANASGMFTFTPASIDAHKGPLTITISPTPGTLTIVGPTTTTSTSTTSTTGAHNDVPFDHHDQLFNDDDHPGRYLPRGPWLLEEASFGVAGHDARARQSDVHAERAVGGVEGAAFGRRRKYIGTTVADADRLLAMFGGRLPYGVPRSSALGRSMVSDRHGLDRYNTGRDTPTCVRDRERG
jgi:hypothetical protein